MKKFSKEYILRKKTSRSIYIGIFIIALIFLGIKVEFSFTRLYKGIPSMLNLFVRMLRPNFSYKNEVFEKLLETIQMAIISSITGVVLALPFSLLIANNITPNKYMANILTGFFSLVRTIPSLIWATLLVSIFSIGKFSGIIALTIIGFLMALKLFREYIEEINENQLNSIVSVGATSLQVLRYCVLPNILQLIISVFFIVFETNIRSATILGLVGAGGVGQIMWRDLNHLRYDNLSTLILILFLTILFIDLFSLYIRKSLLNKHLKYKSIGQYKKIKVFKGVFIPISIMTLTFFILDLLDISYERWLIGINQTKEMVIRMMKIDISYYPQFFHGIGESFFIAVFATMVGAVLTFFLAYFTAYNISPKRRISFLLKGIINILRTFPPIITAIIFFRGIGPGPLAGAMALSLYTTGVLTKMYSEVLENTEENVKNSILSTGASNLQTYILGLFPHTFSNFVSLTLYRLESNIRNATILGIIGAGGIGTMLSMNITWRNWEKVGLLLLGVSLMVMVIDKFSGYVRRLIYK